MYSEALLKPQYRNDPGAQALLRLLQRIYEHDGHSTRPIVAALRGIHNGGLNPVDLELVCKRLELEDFEDVLSTMRFAHRLFEIERGELYRVFDDETTMEVALFG